MLYVFSGSSYLHRHQHIITPRLQTLGALGMRLSHAVYTGSPAAKVMCIKWNKAIKGFGDNHTQCSRTIHYQQLGRLQQQIPNPINGLIALWTGPLRFALAFKLKDKDDSIHH